jgi:hypothetical protein
MPLVSRCAFLLSLILLSGCASTTLRVPASFKPKYDSKISSSLKTAALNGVLFQVNESVFKDVPMRHVDECRESEAPTWSQEFLVVLDLLDHNPQYYNKFYAVEFRRGDRARAEISQDIDGLSSLVVTYSKRENHEKITTLTSLPCQDNNAQHVGKDLITTAIDWPVAGDIEAVLQAAPDKIRNERFHFNTDFLIYLAERQTILKINPEVAFERNYRGDYFLVSWLDKMAEEIKGPAKDLDFITYWMSEIATQSAQAKTIQFFGLHPEASVTYGVQVDKVDKVNRRDKRYQEATYLFMSYREKGGDFISNSLQDLNGCLKTLESSYRSMKNTFILNSSSFLGPDGFSCKLAGEEK